MKPLLTLRGRIAKAWRSVIDPPGFDAMLDALDPGVPIEEVPRWQIVVPCVLMGLTVVGALTAVTFATCDLAALLAHP